MSGKRRMMLSIGLVLVIISASLFTALYLMYRDSSGGLGMTEMPYYSSAMLVEGGRLYAFLDNRTVLKASDDFGASWTTLYNFTESQGILSALKARMFCHDTRGYLYVSFISSNKVFWSRDNGTTFSCLLNYSEPANGNTFISGMDYFNGNLWFGRYGGQMYGDTENPYRTEIWNSSDDGHHWTRHILIANHVHAVQCARDGTVYAGYGDNLEGRPPYKRGVAFLNETSGRFENVTNMALMMTQSTCIMRTDTTTLFFPDEPRAPPLMMLDSVGDWQYPIMWDIGSDEYKRFCYHAEYIDGVVYAPYEYWIIDTGRSAIMASPDDGSTWTQLYEFGKNDGRSCCAGEDGYPYVFFYESRNGKHVLRMKNIGGDEVLRRIYAPSADAGAAAYDQTFYLGNNQTFRLPLFGEGLKDVKITLNGYNRSQLVTDGDFNEWSLPYGQPDRWNWTNAGHRGVLTRGIDGIYGASYSPIVKYKNWIATSNIRLRQDFSYWRSVVPDSYLTVIVPMKGIAWCPCVSPYIIWYINGVTSIYSYFSPISPEFGKWTNYTFSVKVPSYAGGMLIGLTIWPHGSDDNPEPMSKVNESGIFQVDGIQVYPQETSCGLMGGIHASGYQSVETVDPRVRLGGAWHNFSGRFTSDDLIGSWEVQNLGSMVNITVENAAGPVKIRIEGTRSAGSGQSGFYHPWITASIMLAIVLSPAFILIGKIHNGARIPKGSAPLSQLARMARTVRFLRGRNICYSYYA
jgi:hypothetical protein